VCDLDNEPTISVARVVVTVDGKERTFDLCDTHLKAFRAAVAPFAPTGGRGRGRAAKKTVAKKTVAKKTVAKKTVAKKTVAKKTTAKATAAKSTARAAKKTTAKATVAKARPGRPAKAARSAAGASNTAAVRAWARSQGIAVPERGRLGRDLIERYQAANA
jgi:hypothetical protein